MASGGRTTDSTAVVACRAGDRDHALGGRHAFRCFDDRLRRIDCRQPLLLKRQGSALLLQFQPIQLISLLRQLRFLGQLLTLQGQF